MWISGGVVGLRWGVDGVRRSMACAMIGRDKRGASY